MARSGEMPQFQCLANCDSMASGEKPATKSALPELSALNGQSAARTRVVMK
jgi:hypothetical protein